MNIRKLVQLSLSAVIAVTIFMIEAALPALAPVQGMKLGLANIVTLVLLQYYTPREVFLVLLVRILLASIFGGQMMSFLYSLSGGVCCFVAMFLCNRVFGSGYIWLTSMVGAVCHNAGQLLVAFVVLRSCGIVVYVPVLMISGMAAGFFTGVCAQAYHKKMGKLMKRWAG